MRLSIISFAITLLIIVNISFAFSVTAPQENIKVSTGTTRQLPITISSSFSDTIVVYLSEAYPWMGITDSTIKVDPLEEGNTVIIVSPPAGTIPGIYKAAVVSESLLTQERVVKNIFFTISKGDVLDIESIEVTGNLQPDGEITLVVNIDNFKTTTVQDAKLNVLVSSPQDERIFEADQILGRIDPKQKAKESFTFSLPPGAKAGAYEVSVALEHGSGSRTSKQTFFVASKAAIALSEEKFPLLFGYGKTIVARNNGNNIGDVVVEEDLSGFEGAFYNGPVPLSRDPYTWGIKDIPPLGEKSITYRIDFSSLFALLLAIMVIGWVVFFRMRTVRVTKYLMQKKFLEEGEEFTVGVDLRNSSGNNLGEVVVRDFVPTMFKVTHTHGPKPIEKKVVGGKELIWKIEDLYNHEERVLTYKIIPIFGVSGAIRLPPVRVTYRWRNREITRTSFAPRIGVISTVEERPILKRFRRKRR